MSAKISGKLKYYGWNMPCILITELGPVDIWPLMLTFLVSLAHKGVRWQKTFERCSLSPTVANDGFILFYEAGGYPERKREGTMHGALEPFDSLDRSFMGLNGRIIILSFEENAMTIAVDPQEDVFRVSFLDDGKFCGIPSGMEKEVCKSHTSDCCLYLSLDPDKKPVCAKFNSDVAPWLLLNAFNHESRCHRIGNCGFKVPAQKTVSSSQMP